MCVFLIQSELCLCLRPPHCHLHSFLSQRLNDRGMSSQTDRKLVVLLCHLLSLSRLMREKGWRCRGDARGICAHWCEEIGGELERSKQTAERDKKGATRLWRPDWKGWKEGWREAERREGRWWYGGEESHCSTGAVSRERIKEKRANRSRLVCN